MASDPLDDFELMVVTPPTRLPPPSACGGVCKKGGPCSRKPVADCASVNKATNEVTFMLNGEQVRLKNVDPTTTLLTYLRSSRFKGTKSVCREGGCGACTVNLRQQNADGVITSKAINSCLRPLVTINGCSVITTEGLGCKSSGFHPIQQAVADHAASQCGFCTPGWVMNMYSYLASHPDPSSDEIERSFDGNLCRCTGYRPILEAMKSFADKSISDIEDYAGPCNQRSALPVVSRAVRIDQPGASWVNATSWDDLTGAIQQAVAGKQTYRLVAGNTAGGVSPYYEKTKVSVALYIGVMDVPEMYGVKQTADGVRVGGATPFTDVVNSLAAIINADRSPKTDTFKGLVAHILRIGNTQVRNEATVAGSLMLMHAFPLFISDTLTILMGISAVLNVWNAADGKMSQLNVSDFASQDMTNRVIESIIIPYGKPNQHFVTFKVGSRYQNAHAYVNAAFNAVVDPTTHKIQGTPILVFGGVVPSCVHAKNTEAVLANADVTDASVLSAALSALQKELVPDTTRLKPEYRGQLALALLYKCTLAVQPSLPAHLQSAAKPFMRPTSSGQQQFSSDPNEYPVSLPDTSYQAIQGSGEAVYTDDIPQMVGALHAFYVLADIGSGEIDSIDTSGALSLPGVVGVMTGSDCPADRNNCDLNGEALPRDLWDEVLVTKTVQFNGQGLALVLAEDPEVGADAVSAVKVTYKNEQPPILDIDQAIKAQNFYPKEQGPWTPPGPYTTGDFATGYAQSEIKDSGDLYIGGQKHIHLEQHTCLVVPEEDRIHIYIASQWPQLCQNIVSYVTGLPARSIIVTTTRCGGGYGAKITRCIPMACAAALAALKYKRPVRLVLPLKDNMRISGGRHPFKCTYTLGMAKSGKINALKLDLWTDSGFSVDASTGSMAQCLETIDNAYYIPNYEVSGTLVRTNQPSNTAMRGPGCVQGVWIAEAILRRAADLVKLPVETVQALNFYQKNQETPYHQKLAYWEFQTLWNNLLLQADFDNRKLAVQKFNKENMWVKKGIAVTPCKYGIAWIGANYGCLVQIYVDGSVVIAHSGCEIGQGINQKVRQVVAFELNCDISFVSILPSSTDKVPNSFPTGGSITSDLCCVAAIDACKQLNTTLKPTHFALFKTHPHARITPQDWQTLVANAVQSGSKLSAMGWTNPKPSPNGPFTYNTYGAAVSEVRLDVLTGERQILRSDIVYDAGVSLNPAIDIGQVEGAFVQGIGYFLHEEVLMDPKSGGLLSLGTWDYKPPFARDIPIDFRVQLEKNVPNPVGVLSSKATGEPPYCLAVSCYSALMEACNAARTQFNSTAPAVVLQVPATIDCVKMNSGYTAKDFVLA